MLGGDRALSDHGVDLLVQPALQLRVAAQLVEQPRQHDARRLGTRGQQPDDLRQDLVVGQWRTGFVPGLQEQRHEVVVGIGLRPALRDDVRHLAAQQAAGGLEPPVAAGGQPFQRGNGDHGAPDGGREDRVDGVEDRARPLLFRAEGAQHRHGHVLGHEPHLGLQVEQFPLTPARDGRLHRFPHRGDVPTDLLAVEGGLEQAAPTQVGPAFRDRQGRLTEELELLAQQPLGEGTRLAGEHLVDQLMRVDHGHLLGADRHTDDRPVGAQAFDVLQAVSEQGNQVSDERQPTRGGRRNVHVGSHIHVGSHASVLSISACVHAAGRRARSSSRAASTSASITVVGAYSVLSCHRAGCWWPECEAARRYVSARSSARVYCGCGVKAAALSRTLTAYAVSSTVLPHTPQEPSAR